MLIKIIICSFLPRENLNYLKKSKIEKLKKMNTLILLLIIAEVQYNLYNDGKQSSL